MDAADATPPFGAWASIRGYFTPATLFLVLNLVIGTIALTSRTHQRRRSEHHDHHQGQQYQEPLNDPHQQQEYHYYQQPQVAPLARTSSVLDRLRSIGLYRFRSGDFPPEYGAGTAAGASHDAFAPVEEETTTHYARSRSEPAAPAREDEERAPRRTKKKSGTSSLRQEQPSSPPPKAEYQFQEEYVPPPALMRAPPPLSRTSSVLDRLRSLGLYSFLSAEQYPAAVATTDPTTFDDDKKQQAHAHYDRSRSEPAREQQGRKEKKQAAAEARMGKSSSAARKQPAAASRLLVEEDCVDARAEAFIDSFRKEQSQKQAAAPHIHDEGEHVVPPPPAPLARTSSVLDRLRSFGLYLRSGDYPVPEDPVKASPPADEKQQYGRSRSEPAAREQGKKKKHGAAAEARMSKTSSASAAGNMAEEEATTPVEECVDARADDFINKFRQQLHLQRLNSLLNYKEVLNRGAGGNQ